MKHVFLLHLGVGNVGRMLQQYILSGRNTLKKSFGVDLTYCGMFRSSGGIFRHGGLTELEMWNFPKHIDATTIVQAIEDVALPFILIDTTASEQTAPLVIAALARGGFAVLSNKKPLVGPQSQWDTLRQSMNSRLYIETTVGAGLPVIATIQSMIATGDTILEIRGCFSGTLGHIFSSLEDGMPFSRAVLQAKTAGYTEPDPRDDLSGLDVARKALILARLLGCRMELADIPVEALYPENLQNGSVQQFLERISTQDTAYENRMKKAQQSGKTLRYVAWITPTSCSVGIHETDKISDIGQLKGPDNCISIRTKRYNANPLVIKGPGAGIEVTAAGAFGDIVQIMKQIALMGKSI